MQTTVIESIKNTAAGREAEDILRSGVRYGRLVDIGRETVEERVPRSFSANLLRSALRRILPYPQRCGALLNIGRRLRPGA